MFQPRRRGHRREGLGLLLLLHQLYRLGFDRIPPVTLATVAANVLIYLRVLNPYIKTVIRSPQINNICVSSAHVWYQGDWPRLFLAAWFHLDEWHLYYNMVSFVWKGITLERKFGTPYFAYLILVFAGLTNALLVGLNVGIAELLMDSSYIKSCAAGFSGVIFALKVLTTYYTPVHTQRIMGLFSVPSRWACWVELVLIQVMVPRASFTGHLAGILVGLAYVKGPLKVLMDAMWSLVTSGFTGGARQQGRFQPRADTTGFQPRENNQPTNRSNFAGRGFATGSGSGTAYARPARPSSSATYPSAPTQYPGSGSGMGGAGMGGGGGPTLPNYSADDFTGGLNEEEQMRRAMRESMSNSASSSYHHSDSAMPSAPPYTEEEGDAPRLYPELSRDAPPPSYPQNGGHASAEDLRRRRLARLDR